MIDNVTPDNLPPEKMLSRIRALLAKAEDEAATKPEAEAFMAKATELMARYGITRALVADKEPGSDPAADKIFTVEAPYAERKAHFLYNVADALGCKGVRLGKGPRATVRIHLFGMQSDLERVEVLFTSLLLQLHRFIAADYAIDPRAWDNARKWRADYMRGFAATVTTRIRQSEQQAKRDAESERASSGPSVALVLVKRHELVSSALAAKYPHRTTRRDSTRIGFGYGRGRSAGARADLAGTSLSGRATHVRLGPARREE